jgi:hypothetical protein
MNLPKPRTKEERAALTNAVHELQREWGFVESFGLRELLGRWVTFVEEVEGGYKLSLADYTNDLALRDAIEQLKSTLPNRLRSEISQVLEPWDHRFQFATKPSRMPVLAGDASAGPWWWRIPKVTHGEMLENLLADDTS